MDGEDPFYRLQLDHYFPFNDQVDLVSAIKSKTLEGNWKCDLPFEGQPTQVQLVTQAFFIRGL